MDVLLKLRASKVLGIKFFPSDYAVTWQPFLSELHAKFRRPFDRHFDAFAVNIVFGEILAFKLSQNRLSVLGGDISENIFKGTIVSDKKYAEHARGNQREDSTQGYFSCDAKAYPKRLYLGAELFEKRRVVIQSVLLVFT